MFVFRMLKSAVNFGFSISESFENSKTFNISLDTPLPMFRDFKALVFLNVKLSKVEYKKLTLQLKLRIFKF